MKYIKFTYVDSLTGKSILDEPSLNGPKFPEVGGLEFVWARESDYPTELPEFFGTCPDNSDINRPGVLAEFLKEDWEQMQADELSLRNPVPASVSMRQARLALLQKGLLDDVEGAILTAGPAAKIEWEYGTEVKRTSGLIQQIATILGITNKEIDDLFILAVTL